MNKASGPFDELRARLDEVLSRDRPALQRRWRKLAAGEAGEKARARLQRDIDASAAQRAARAASLPQVRIDEALPIAARAQEIIAALREHQVLVVAGETGSGKTTQLPKLALAAGRGAAGLIGCTQPRRLAARAMARRVAEELGGPLGDQVGFQVRFSEQIGPNTLVKFMTDGILLAETRHDRGLHAYDTLIIDEAHERSLNIDFLLGYLKRLAHRRPELKIIITSATIDTARFAAHFAAAPVIEVAGRGYPVALRWRPAAALAGQDNLAEGSAEHVALALDEITRDDPRGDVLVFLPGEREIRDMHRLLQRRAWRHTEILPLYARLSARDQDRVFKPGPARRIVLATNIAETSLTVPRIRYVVDSGSARVKRYSRRRQIEQLHIEPISQAAADQRKGRCGRIGPGLCVRLYDEADFAARPRYTDPELLCSSLAGVILRMLDRGLGEIEDFPFLDPPQAAAVADGYRRLAELQAIDGERRLTRIGHQMARHPVDVQLARMLVEADKLQVRAELRVIVAFLGVQDPRERPPDARGRADAAHREFADDNSDFLGILKLWQAFDAAHQTLTQRKLRDWCTRHFLSYPRMREWRQLHRQLVVGPGTGNRDPGTEGQGPRLGKARDPIPDSPFPVPGSRNEPIHCALLAGLPTQVARKDEEGAFRGTRQRRFQVFPGSALAKKPPEWLLAAQILDMGGRVWGMLCARIDPRWVERQAAHLLRHTLSDPHWSRRRGQVVASEQVSLFGLVLVERRTVAFARQDPPRAHAVFLQQALATCEIDSRLNFIAHNRQLLQQAAEREARERRQGLLREADERADFFVGKLPASVSSRAALEKWHRGASAEQRAALRWSLDDVLVAGAGQAPDDYPPHLAIAGQSLLLRYRFQPGDQADGVTLRLPLALLNALPAERCQWLVPGLLPDKVAALIKSLPKKLRRNFVPAPDFARAFCAAEEPGARPLAQALAAFLTRTTGVPLEAEDLAGAELPAHLLMRFELVDEAGKLLACGRDLEALRRRWGGQARRAFAGQAAHALPRQAVIDWAFGTLPERVPGAAGVAAWVAVCDQGDAARVQVFEDPAEARAAHAAGVTRLLRIALAPVIKRAARQLPVDPRIDLQTLALGDVLALRADIVEGALRDLLAGADLDVRDAAAFSALRDTLASGLFASAVARLEPLQAIVRAHAELRPWLQPPMPGFAAASYDDLAAQLAALLPAGFARHYGNARLHHVERYLRAMRRRAERLQQDPARDQRQLLDVLPFQQALDALVAAGRAGPAVEDLRWLIEEFRVSLFAQEIGTAVKVSAPRLARALRDLQAGA